MKMCCPRYAQNTVQLEKLRANNRAAAATATVETTPVSQMEPIQPGTEWDRSVRTEE